MKMQHFVKNTQFYFSCLTPGNWIVQAGIRLWIWLIFIIIYFVSVLCFYIFDISQWICSWDIGLNTNKAVFTFNLKQMVFFQFVLLYDASRLIVFFLYTATCETPLKRKHSFLQMSLVAALDALAGGTAFSRWQRTVKDHGSFKFEKIIKLTLYFLPVQV